jgi:hypothetical protein
MNKETLVAKIFDLADDYGLYGCIVDEELTRSIEMGVAPEYVAERFTDQDGGESSDEFYECLCELF